MKSSDQRVMQQNFRYTRWISEQPRNGNLLEFILNYIIYSLKLLLDRLSGVKNNARSYISANWKTLRYSKALCRCHLCRKVSVTQLCWSLGAEWYPTAFGNRSYHRDLCPGVAELENSGGGVEGKSSVQRAFRCLLQKWIHLIWCVSLPQGRQEDSWINSCLSVLMRFWTSYTCDLSTSPFDSTWLQHLFSSLDHISQDQLGV